MALLVRAAQSGDEAAVSALVAVLTPTVFHVIRALWGPQRADLAALTSDVVVGIVRGLPTWRGECTLLHFAARIAARRAVAAPPPDPPPLFRRILRRRGSDVWGTPWEEELRDRRRELLRTVFSELPDTQGEAMILRLALGYSLEEIALVTTTPVAVVRSRLRSAKDALRARIEADPDWYAIWGEDG